MDKQEIFDRVYTGLVAQGYSCVNDRSECVYRYENESGQVSRCAVGMLIRDSDYFSVDYPESLDPVDWLSTGKLQGIDVPAVKADLDELNSFLIDLQNAHDNAYIQSIKSQTSWVSRYNKRMLTIAKVNGLNTYVIEDCEEC